MARVRKSKDEASAEDLAVGARLYFECAIAADEKVGRLPGYELVAPFPVMQNTCQAIELALKSWLKDRGVPCEQRFGHSLSKLYEKCVAIDDGDEKLFSSIDIGALENLNQLYEGEVLRYGGGPLPRRVPHFGPVRQMAHEIFKACNISELEDYMVAS